MQNILFFDSDNVLNEFISQHPNNLINPILLNKTLNSLSKSDLRPYLNCQIISCFTHSEILSTQKLDLFPDLKLIATRSTGFNHIDLEYCKKRGIIVENVPNYGAVTVAEFAFSLILAFSRKIISAQNDMKQNRINIKNYMGFDLFGKTIGIIGTGSIGQHMIQLAQGFGMSVLAYDLYPKSNLKQFYVSDIQEIFKKSDIISLHVPSTKRNHHLINKKAFREMKRDVIIINTARGDLIDTQALYTALKNGTVSGAGLDVLENEDFLLHDDILTTQHITDTDFLLDSAMNLKLLQFKNVIATPHIAFDSIDAINRINQMTWDNILCFIQGKVINQVR